MNLKTLELSKIMQEIKHVCYTIPLTPNSRKFTLIYRKGVVFGGVEIDWRGMEHAGYVEIQENTGGNGYAHYLDYDNHFTVPKLVKMLVNCTSIKLLKTKLKKLIHLDNRNQCSSFKE